MNHFITYDSPIGKLRITEDETGITNIDFPDEQQHVPAEEKTTPLLEETVKQLTEYFAGKRTNFDISLHIKGTNFQHQVWQELLKIPYGEIRSYKQVAESAGNPKASRAVGLANNRNPIPILIPCHRVIGTNGSLVGYGGGLEIKKFLLDLEKNNAERLL